MQNGDQELTTMQVRRADGQTIAVALEAASAAPPHAPLVIVVPPYGKTIRDLVTTSSYLTANGFRTWRFDFTNHLGASDGEIFNFSLSSAAEDVRTIVAAARAWHPAAPLGVVSASLGSRVVFRALRGRQDVSALVSLVGTVNVQKTLHRILGDDLIGDLLANRPLPASRSALGYEIDIRFIHDAVEHGFHSLESTTTDVDACRFPIVQIHAGADAWTESADVEHVFRPSVEGVLRGVYLLPATSHKLEHNPTAARVALRQTVIVLKRHLTGQDLQPDDVACPTFLDIVTKHRQERVLEQVGYRSAELALAKEGSDERPQAADCRLWRAEGTGRGQYDHTGVRIRPARPASRPGAA
jgi:hypothetical protein